MVFEGETVSPPPDPVDTFTLMGELPINREKNLLESYFIPNSQAGPVDSPKHAHFPEGRQVPFPEHGGVPGHVLVPKIMSKCDNK